MMLGTVLELCKIISLMIGKTTKYSGINGHDTCNPSLNDSENHCILNDTYLLNDKKQAGYLQ